MTSLEFVYWLQGFLEISQPEVVTKEQIEIIRQHIGLVLYTVDPVKKGELKAPSLEEILKDTEPTLTFPPFCPPQINYPPNWILRNDSPTQKELEENMFKVFNLDNQFNSTVKNDECVAFTSKLDYEKPNVGYHGGPFDHLKLEKRYIVPSDNVLCDKVDLPISPINCVVLNEGSC